MTFVRLIPADRLAELERIEELAKKVHGPGPLSESLKATTELKFELGLITEKEYREIRSFFR